MTSNSAYDPHSEHLDEQALIAALKNGEAAAFSQFVSTYQHMVYNTTLGFVQTEADAEDITQDVFLTVFQSVNGFKGESKLSTWLYRIAVTKSLEWLRKKGRKKRSADLKSLEDGDWHIPHFHHPGVQLEQKEQAAILFAAIKKLPEQQQTAFLLSQTEQLSQVEIAGVMNTSVSSVESLLFRARQKLRTLLAHYYEQYKNQGS